MTVDLRILTSVLGFTDPRYHNEMHADCVGEFKHHCKSKPNIYFIFYYIFREYIKLKKKYNCILCVSEPETKTRQGIASMVQIMIRTPKKKSLLRPESGPNWFGVARVLLPNTFIFCLKQFFIKS